MVDWGQIEQKRGAAETAARTAGEYGTRGITLADELRKALGTRFGETGIPQATAEARAGFLQAPSQIRSDIAQQVGAGTIYSPSQQQAISSSRLASAMVPLSAANIIQSGAMGTMEDMIGAGTRAWQSQVGQKNLEAQLAQTGYQNMLNEMLQRAAEERAAEEARRTTEMHPLQMALKQAEIDKAKRVSKSGGMSSLQQLTYLEKLKDLVSGPDLSNKERETARQAQDLITRIEGIEQTLGGKTGWLQDMFTGVTGPLSGIFGEYRTGAGTRKDIGNLEAELKKGKYGSVLSGYEMKEYPKWGISQKYQEQKNRNALAALKNKAEIELRNLTGGQTGGFSGGGWSLTGRTQ